MIHDSYPRRASEPFEESQGLSVLFHPASVAIIGASDDTRKYGNWIATQALGATIPVFLVNRSRSSVLGHTAYPSAREIGAPIDLAVLSVPAAGFEEAVEDALAAGARAIVSISGGLGENGEHGRAIEQRVVARVRAAGARLLGPNCLGVLDHAAGLAVTSNPFPPGSIALLSQSGNIAIEIAAQLEAHGLGLSRFASLGNQADIDIVDLMESSIDDPNTTAIAVYCEDFRDGRRFARAAKRAWEHGKPVVLLTVGRTEASARNARSHTGSLVTPSTVVAAVSLSAGIEQVSAPAELADLLAALSAPVQPIGTRVAILADGGGHASVASDVVAEQGLQIDRFSPELSSRIAQELPATAAVANPIDVAGGGEQDIESFARVLTRLAESPEADAILMTGYFGGYGQYGAELAERELETARQIVQDHALRARPLIVHTMRPDSAAASVFRAAAIPVYPRISTAAWVMRRARDRATAPAPQIPEMPPAALPARSSDYFDLRSLLADAGIPFPEARRVTQLSQAQEFAREHHFPLVLKALGDDHKSDRGGVKLALSSEAELVAAWTEIQQLLRPEACSVEVMLRQPGAVELIVGARWEPRFGSTVIVGLGGVYAEIFRDVRVELGPVSAARADAMLRSLRGGALLTGARGIAPVNLETTAELIARFSEFAAAHPEFSELECNPVSTSPAGATALDARAVWAI